MSNSSTDDTVVGWFIVASVVIGLMFGVFIASNYQRGIFCPALLDRAETGTDSIAIATEFGGCVRDLRGTP